MPTINYRLAGLCLLAGAGVMLSACVPNTNQGTQPASPAADTATAEQFQPVAPSPNVDFPADRNPSWITSAFPQEPTDEEAVAELEAMGLEFNGKQFVEQVIQGNRLAVELYLRAGISPDMRSLGGTTALMAAADSGHDELVRLLVERGADVTLREYRTTEMTALLYAAQNGFTDIAAYLLDHGADVNECDGRLETSLYKAVMEQHADLVALLLERGAAVDQPVMRLTTPLTYGTGYPSLDIVKLLVEAGADLNAVDASGSTPLLVAAKFGKPDNFFYLLEQGATNFGESFTGYNCLHAAAESGAVDIAAALVGRGYDVNQPDSRTARTPLVIAIANQRLELTKWLLENGADPLPRCIFGYNALDLIRRLQADCAVRTAEERERDGLPDLSLADELLDLAETAAAGAYNAGGSQAREPLASGTPAAQNSHPTPERQPYDQTRANLPQPSVPDETLAQIDRINGAEIARLTADQARQLLADHEIEFNADTFIETCIFGWRKLFDVFLAAGIDVNAQRADGGNAITAACLLGDPDMVQTLIDHGADLDSTFGENQSPCLHYAVLSRQPAVVDLLLDSGQDVDVRDVGGRTALMRAAEQGDREMAAHLIDKGADVNAVDNIHLTALHWAVRSGKLDVIKLLVERGADINMADSNGITPVYAAAMYGQEPVYSYLRDQGAPIDIASSDGTSMIHAAVFGGNRQIVADLLDHGQDINARHPLHGVTPIFGALDRPDPDIDFIRFLLDRGAEVNLFDSMVGYSPLMLAALGGNTDVFRLLIDRGADYNAVNKDGVSVLHVTVQNDNPEMIRILLALGVDVNIRASQGNTPLDWAVEFRCNRVEPILREAMGLPPKDQAAGSDAK